MQVQGDMNKARSSEKEGVTMEQNITCINCPLGCRMTVRLTPEGAFESVSGNTCKKGAVYAEQECTAPMRMVTAVIPVRGSRIPLSVKTSAPIPKELIRDVMKQLANVEINVPVALGQIIIHHVLGTQADIVATRSILHGSD